MQVVGTTPLPGLGTPLADVPANVQSFNRSDFDRQRPLELTDFLGANANSVAVSAAQGNPYQQDISFRGFIASPLLGAPQGLSVFQDGVRLNEALGDVVNWDLLPQSAISSIQLVPGSNPVFGLNTLGGALAIYTRSGAQYPGAAAELTAGSFGRSGVELEYGGAHAPPRLLRHRQLRQRNRLGGAQRQRGQAVLRQARLPGRRHRFRPQPDPRRQHAAGHADASASLARHADPALHVPGRQPEPGRLLDRQRQPLPRRDAAARPASPTIATTTTTISAATSTPTTAASIRKPGPRRPTRPPMSRRSSTSKAGVPGCS